MPLTAGTRLGPYEVLTQIGAGGMGEVYRATDTKLKRQVAIKVLPASVSGDVERLARLQREAEVLASLNHPNIAAIYGLEDADGVKALVMELVEGPTLADRIAQGAIPPDEAFPIATQIAEALEAAHEQGVIHRDLKPANIKVRPDGTVKVLDFGLAKAMESPNATSGSASHAPTITTPAMTKAGVILGTAAYMSPEQARGRIVDRRTDIWAFGCVLYEMLAGQRAFRGVDVMETLAAVVNGEPQWARLPQLDSTIGMFLRQCLRKEPKQRLPDAATMRLALTGAFDSMPADRPSNGRSTSVWRQSFIRVAAMLVVTGAVAGFLLSQGITRPAMPLPIWTGIETGSYGDVAISPDGTSIVRAGEGGLFIRRLDQPTSQLIPNSQDAVTYPFFSPDGRAVGFALDAGVARISIDGGRRVSLGDVRTYGSSWGPDGTVIVGVRRTGLLRVSENGGKATTVTSLGPSDLGHQSPNVLPGGQRVVFTVWRGTVDSSTIAVAGLKTGDIHELLPGVDPQYVNTGHLLFGRAGALWAVPFEPRQDKVMSEPVQVLENVQVNNGLGTASFAVSDTGTLVFLSGSDNARSLVWVDRKGREESLPIEPSDYWYVRLSPDGDRVVLDDRNGGRSLWVWHLMRGTRQRLVLGDSGGQYPAWTRDGLRVAYGDTAGGISETNANGTGTPLSVLRPEGLARSERHPYFLTADGKTIVFREQRASDDIGMAATNGESPPTWLLDSPFNERNAELSPDGRWVAYQSDLSSTLR